MSSDVPWLASTGWLEPRRVDFGSATLTITGHFEDRAPFRSRELGRLAHACLNEDVTLRLVYTSEISDFSRFVATRVACIELGGALLRHPFKFECWVALARQTLEGWASPPASARMALDLHDPVAAQVNVDRVLDMGVRPWLCSQGVDAKLDLAEPVAHDVIAPGCVTPCYARLKEF